MNIGINKIKSNKKNPRLIKTDKYRSLLKSIKELDGMMQVNPLTLDIDNMILAGNMRLKACKELGWKKVPVSIYTMEIHKASDAFLVFNKTYQQACDEITIKDNTHAGEWDYDILANEWSEHNLNDYGLDLWETDIEEMKTPNNIDTENIFATELDMQSNYLVLRFTTDIDWLQAKTLFGLNTETARRSNGKEWSKGIGRVLDGVKAINKLKDEN